MLTIPIALSGDYCMNSQEVEDRIRCADVTEPVYLDFQAEGVSITTSNIIDMLLRICRDTGRSADTIKLINNPNVVEHTPFENINATKSQQQHQPFRSHFLSGDLLRDYWCDTPTVNSDTRLFGLFIGRRTVARDMILRQCQQQPQRFLFSMMNDHMGISAVDEQEIHEWITDAEVQDFQQWRHTVKIASLDNKSIRDQYRRFVPHPVTNRSILAFYPQFRIEIVPETYTRGDTFFPTEKTARPIMAEKPVLVYGPRNFLARLRDLYGFRTYGDCWDEGYDDLEGAPRWRAMWRAMQDISGDTLDQRASNIAQHNRRVLAALKEWEI